ncbi:unnamed protein product [Camellia sinensis]
MLPRTTCYSYDESCTSCLTIWCPCVTFGRIAKIVDEGETLCCASGAGYLLLYGWAHICAPLYSCGYRFNCEKYALCQEYREMERKCAETNSWSSNGTHCGGRHEGLASQTNLLISL